MSQDPGDNTEESNADDVTNTSQDETNEISESKIEKQMPNVESDSCDNGFETVKNTEDVQKTICNDETNVDENCSSDDIETVEENAPKAICEELETKNNSDPVEVENKIDVTNSENEDDTTNGDDGDDNNSDGLGRQSSVDTVIENKGRQSSTEEYSQQPYWSFSQWSENYESLEDERCIEDLDGDPKKLILWAAEKNELEIMRKLLEEDPSLVNATDNDLYTPLHRACYSNNVEVIKFLLSYEADISARTADGWQPLHCASKWDSVEAVSLLLQNGADVNAQTKGHVTPLHLAASNVSGRRTLELLLWQQYIDPNVRNDAGDTAYDIANRSGPLGALFEILEESVNVY